MAKVKVADAEMIALVVEGALGKAKNQVLATKEAQVAET